MDYTTSTVSKIYELYDFAYNGVHYRYTSYPIAVIVDGEAYTAGTIERDTVEKDSDFSRGKLKIRCVQTPLLLNFLGIAPPTPIEISLYRHQPDLMVPATELLFRGRIESITFDLGQRCTISAIENSTMLSYKFPTWIYQPTCNKILYSSDCGAIRTAYKLTVIADILTTPAVMWSVDATVNGDKYYSWGTAEFGGEKRLIISQNGAQVIFQVPFTALQEGDSVDIYPGCTKTAAECKNKFSNLANFMGFPHIPRKNPVWTGL